MRIESGRRTGMSTEKQEVSELREALEALTGEVANWALQLGENWRTGVGVELMDAYHYAEEMLAKYDEYGNKL